jgi:hypothetical protein
VNVQCPYCTLVRVNFSIILAEETAASEYSLGASFILLRHSRDIESATPFVSPEMNSKLEEYSERAIYHRISDVQEVAMIGS